MSQYVLPSSSGVQENLTIPLIYYYLFISFYFLMHCQVLAIGYVKFSFYYCGNTILNQLQNKTNYLTTHLELTLCANEANLQ